MGLRATGGRYRGLHNHSALFVAVSVFVFRMGRRVVCVRSACGRFMVRLRRLPRFHVFGRSGLRPARPAGPRVEPRVLLKENVIIRVA